MIWLGIKNWRVRTVSLESALRGSKHRAITRGAAVEGEIRRFPFFMEGITLQMTNPMLIMFFVSLFPQFIDPSFPTGRSTAFWPRPTGSSSSRFIPATAS